MTVRDGFVAALGFPLDPFQVRALDALDADHSVLVAAPTGSGKTVVAEYALARARTSGGKVFYTSPIKALSNQKFRDLVAAHGPERVGLLTGDNSIRGEAPIVVMTTEVLRNMIFAGSSTLDGLECVVLDEVHYLQDPERGAVWEEVIIHLPAAVRLVCLSATVANADEVGDWLATVRGQTDVVVETQRPVALDEHYAVGDRRRGTIRLVPVFQDGRANLDAGAFDATRPARRGGRFGVPRRAELIEEMAARDMLPAIVFVFSRDGCEAAVGQVRSLVGRLTDGAARRRIREIAEEHTDGVSDEDLRVLGYGPWLDALEAGFAAHHAGVVPPMKEAVEHAFTEGLVSAVFATETLALGVNMPARSVVIERLTKFTGERHEYLTPGEYRQLTGRAGRRGIDDHGFAVVCWSPWTTFGDVAALAASPPSPLTSSFRPTYSTAANLVRRYDAEEAHRLLNLSFGQFRADRDVVALERELARRREHLEALRRESPAQPRGAHRAPGTDGAVGRLAAQVERLERRIRRRDRNLARQLDRVLGVLEAWGYVTAWALTDAGEVLAGLSTEADLLVAESIRTGVLDGLDAADLGAVVSCFTFERRARATPSEVTSSVLAERYGAVERLWRILTASETDAELPLTRSPDPGFAGSLRAWIGGADLAALVGDDLAPGDFVRHVKQCMDLLRQIADLGVEPVAGTAADAARRCMRGLVETSTLVGV